jgi:hypothetical protein
MSPAVVYRIEHRTKKQERTGFFHGPCVSSSEHFGNHRIALFNIPGPFRDDLTFYPKNPDKFLNRIWAFALRPQDLFRIERDREAYREAGFVLRTYMCPPGTVDIGNTQAMFHYFKAECLATEDF